MSDPFKDSSPERTAKLAQEQHSSRISVSEIAKRLNIGRVAVYSMLGQGIIPGIRLGRRWIVTHHAYEQWERTCGMRAGAGLRPQPEVKGVELNGRLQTQVSLRNGVVVL